MKPCPFCGSEKISVMVGLSKTEVWCYDCGAHIIRRGKNTPHYSDAVKAWNTRVNESGGNSELEPKP